MQSLLLKTASYAGIFFFVSIAFTFAGGPGNISAAIAFVTTLLISIVYGYINEIHVRRFNHIGPALLGIIVGGFFLAATGIIG